MAHPSCPSLQAGAPRPPAKRRFAPRRASRLNSLLLVVAMLFNIAPRSPTKVRFASRARRLICLPLIAAMMFESAVAHVVATPDGPVDPLKDLLLREDLPLARPKAKAQALTTSSECRLDEFTSVDPIVAGFG